MRKNQLFFEDTGMSRCLPSSSLLSHKNLPICQFFCNFALSFTKSGLKMRVSNSISSAQLLHSQNYAFKENWKSTAPCFS